MPFARARAENQCSICRHVKSPSDFYIGTKKGILIQLPKCKACSKIASAADRKKRAAKIKERTILKKDEIAEYQKGYRIKNAERLRRFYAERYLKRKAAKPPRVFKTAEEKAEKKKARLRLPENRIKCRIRHRLFICLRDFGNGTKSKSGLSYVGCSIPELKRHLESQFKKGMSWANHSKTGWHIDHVIPCSSFDHADEKQIYQCWHFSNLRPMWAKQNLKKGAKITNPQMSLLL